MKRRRGGRPAKHDPAREGKQFFTPTEDPRAPSEAAAGPGELKAAETADAAPRSDAAGNRRSARAFLIAAAQAAVFVPAIFYLRFGEINAYALSFTAFLVVLCLLVALGYSIPDKRAGVRPEPQTPAAKVGLFGRVGAFWLLACAFGPFFGWLVTAPAFPVTEGNWWWRYVARAALSVGLPVLTALPLFAYARGKYWHIALLLLFGVTSLAAWSGANTLRDLSEGPSVRSTTGFYDAPNNSFYPAADGRPFKLTTLAHTGRTIRIEPGPPDAR
jgi:hypothetical protein